MTIAILRQILFKASKGKCTFCKTTIALSDLRDEASRSEFQISGICQQCQDKIFLTSKTTNA